MAAIFEQPSELVLTSLQSRFPCREQQIRILATLLYTKSAPCKNIVIYGLEATGKSSITKALLDALSSPPRLNGINGHSANEFTDLLSYAIINSEECITGRHLLERTLGAVASALQWKGNLGRCENTSQLVVEIGKLLESAEASDRLIEARRRLVLVYDGIDRQKDAPSTLLPALARIGEIIPTISTVFIVTAPRPNFLHMPGAPHIHFTTYTKAELLRIMSLSEPTPQLPGGLKETQEVWSRFCSAAWDSLAKHSGRDLLSFRSICSRLWPTFIKPIIEGTYSSKEFSRLLVANRVLFQNENVLVPNILSDSSDKAGSAVPTCSHTKQLGVGTQLPYFSRLLLVAAYLSSFNPPRTDQILFMKAAAAKRKKKGGGTALAKSKPGVSKSRKLSRKLLGPQVFVLERMLAIFHAIRIDADDRMRKGADAVAGSADIQMAFATLASLRLLVKVGGVNSIDVLDGGSRWKVAVGWDTVRTIARSVGVEAEDYLAD
ncbi:origin recognition complex subunit 5 C-terminus-domain-containing protein [Xylogone sp. PMI_703]|nr:origin recognition complex subunit 5 C-terminus-domain-containing protein [Xylogone sp. PMI_703]